MKSKNGITLIALVITVIVLLILAGVSISLVVGNNGVLTQASNAVIENRKASAREDVEMAWTSAEADYWSDWAKNTNIPNIFEYYQEKLSSYLGITTDKIEEENENADYKYKVDYGGYVFKIDEIGKVAFDGEGTAVNTGESGTGSSTGGNTGGNGSGSGTGESSSITTYTVTFYANSGDTEVYATKTVNENETIGSSNMPTNPTKDNYTFAGWKKELDYSEFTASTTISENIRVYADWTADPIASFGTANLSYTSKFGYKVSGYSPSKGSNWRLFYADSNFAYLISDSIGGKTLNNSTMAEYVGDMTSSAFALGRNLNSKYTATGNWALKTDGTNINSNIKGVSALLNTSKWTDYKTSDAEWAIGAPTIEMFIASYNATHTTQLDCRVESSTSTGYQLKKGEESFAKRVEGLGKYNSLDYAIYCYESGGWWLSSPASDGDRYVLYVYGGTISKMICGNQVGNSHDIRPLVCVPLSKIETGQITIGTSY